MEPVVLEQLTGKDFDEVYAILEESFPVDERRPYSRQKALLENPIYKVLGLRDRENGHIQGILAIYELDSVIFLEHFAIRAGCRNLGLGSRMLRELGNSGKPVCLEVELPDTELARRRIGFYQRNGFCYQDYPYLQPPLAEGQNGVPLRLMTSGQLLDGEEFQRLKTLLYTQVYGCQ